MQHAPHRAPSAFDRPLVPTQLARLVDALRDRVELEGHLAWVYVGG